MTKQRSCLIEKISHFIALSDHDQRLVARLEEAQRSYPKGELIRREGDPASELFVVKSGWVTMFSSLDEGARHIHDLHFPGDIIGIRDIVYERASVSIQAQGDVVVCPFPKSALDDIFVQSPRLSALLFAFGVLETTTVFDRLRAVARLDALKRLGYFLLQIQSRLRITQRELGNSFELPLTQELIGDALGLSQVHVNRTMKEMESDGLLRRYGRSMIEIDAARLAELTEFSDRYYRIDTSWFPRQSNRPPPDRKR